MQHGSRNRSSHSATLPEWLPQPLSHSATLPEWLPQPLSHSATLAERLTQPLSHSAALPEWLDQPILNSMDSNRILLNSLKAPSFLDISYGIRTRMQIFFAPIGHYWPIYSYIYISCTYTYIDVHIHIHVHIHVQHLSTGAPGGSDDHNHKDPGAHTWPCLGRG